MKLFDRHGRVRERALTLQSLRGREAPGAPATAPDGDRLLIRFNYPNDIRGTGFLVWEHPKVDDERFLYLPSLGRVRRIAGAETQESFVGSDFTYEDIGGRELEDFTYAFAGPDQPWTAPAGGPPRDAWRLESRRKDASAEFPRVVSIVLKDSFVVVGAEVYNRRNEKQKIYTVRRLQQIEGIWTIMESEMTDARGEDAHRARRRGDGLQRRVEGERLQPPRAGAGQVSRLLAGVIYRWRFPLSAFIILGALALAPRANITRIDNDVTAWFSRADPVYQDYERFRQEFAGTRSLIIALKADSPERLFSAGTLGDDSEDDRRHRARRHGAAGLQPRHRDDRPGAAGAARGVSRRGGRRARRSAPAREPRKP